MSGRGPDGPAAACDRCCVTLPPLPFMPPLAGPMPYSLLFFAFCCVRLIAANVLSLSACGITMGRHQPQFWIRATH